MHGDATSANGSYTGTVHGLLLQHGSMHATTATLCGTNGTVSYLVVTKPMRSQTAASRAACHVAHPGQGVPD